MAWQSYNTDECSTLDQIAQRLVLNAREADRSALNQSFKMREAVAYGLERFWGEHLRLQTRDTNKSCYWNTTWNALVSIMAHAGVSIPNDQVDVNDTVAVNRMAQKLWALDRNDQRITLAVLTQLCDCIVWWTQRYKGSAELIPDEIDETE